MQQDPQPPVAEATIDQKVAIFMDAGNGPEATAEYRATLEATEIVASEPGIRNVPAEEVAASDAVDRAMFQNAVHVLGSESSTETKFAVVAEVFEMIARGW